MSIVLSNTSVVGSGAYGKVYVGTHDGKRMATKRRYIVDQPNVPPGCVHVNEVDIMCSIRHPNILHAITMQKQNPLPDSFRGDTVGPNGTPMGNVSFRADLVYLLTDAADGDMSSFSINESSMLDNDMDKDTLRSYMWQILMGIAHLHRNGYIHRDIKPANILFFDDNNSGDRVIKLCDFDMCLPMIPTLESSKAMTPEYTPPEILIQPADVIYSDKVDVWGAGCTMYHLVKGESFVSRGDRRGDDLDYYILSIQKQYLPNGNGIDIPSNISKVVDTIIASDLSGYTLSLDLGDKDANDLLLHMLDCNPDTRYSILDCMKHPFFKGMDMPTDIEPIGVNQYGDMIINDHILANHHITEEMATVFDSKITTISDTDAYGFFLGLDILMRVCVKKYRGDGRNLAICCFNLGMKYYNKEIASFMRIDNEDAKRIEYSIISKHLNGNIYRDNVYNHIGKDAIKIYRYLLAQDLFPNKLSVLVNVIRRALDV